MPHTADEVILVTEVPAFEIVDDRLQFVITSGKRQRTYSISRHKAFGAIHVALRLLEDSGERESNVREFRKRH